MGKSPYSESFRKEAVRKFLTRGSRSVGDLAKELGVSTFTLYGWARIMSQNSTQSTKAKSQGLMAADKFESLVSFLRLPEKSQGEYLRKKGLTSAQLSSWETELKSKLDSPTGASSAKAEVAQSRTRIKLLEKEIRRKDRALAETAALLVLSKKLEALWGTELDEVL